jgi:hypothetical protein
VTESILRWLLCAQVPSTFCFLAAAVNADLTEAQILDLCCNLVVRDKNSLEFRFAHLSVQEYLEGRPEFSEEAVNACAVSRCIDLITKPKERRTGGDLFLQHSTMRQVIGQFTTFAVVRLNIMIL